ncbi:MAG: hypothetical protein A2Y57_02750 [Candidatus Woykebacteria bacterium RBG_13_40_7b]|uniref:Uncharacterized protein n=1 Tax=Candidatus Woykebacteria bacterium RBG_13_40_7b TaxID=1802594 RepID=A0A1G1WBH5_9BACT|nr:MAG: hypothetical protein A2Y57_02750 [Candidatus Woykebacteria bacterium RBG_13_40_7b]
MIGIIFAILGGFTAVRLWSSNFPLAVIAVIATIYQLSSLREMMKERHGYQEEDRFQTTLNIISSLIIIGLLIFSFFK